MKTSVIVVAIVSFIATMYQFYPSGPAAQARVVAPRPDRRAPRANVPRKKPEQQVRHEPLSLNDPELDREMRLVMESGITLEQRKRQITAIATAFARRTDPQRARRLAVLCYLKTLGTPFAPIDIAEIALAETGNFKLSGKTVSPMGARGVWQVMPSRAKQHGYFPREMENDQKCADAAVRELASKLIMARGNMTKAKKLYCGAGREANAYEVVRRQYRREIIEELRNAGDGGLRGSEPRNNPHPTLANR